MHWLQIRKNLKYLKMWIANPIKIEVKNSLNILKKNYKDRTILNIKYKIRKHRKSLYFWWHYGWCPFYKNSSFFIFF